MRVIAASTATLKEKLTMMEAHQWLGHITPNSVRHLVWQGIVTGVELLEPSEVTPCDSCTYAKMTHKAIPKECEGPCMTNFGAEIHSDVWGPSPTKTLSAHKGKALQAYLTFKAWSSTQHSAKNEGPPF